MLVDYVSLNFKGVYMTIEEILKDWQENGDTFKKGLPACPSFVYRKSGDWISWNDFLGSEDPENDKIDKIENKAWKIYLNSKK